MIAKIDCGGDLSDHRIEAEKLAGYFDACWPARWTSGSVDRISNLVRRSSTITNSNRIDEVFYVPVFRNTLPPLFAVFDFADPNIQGGKRTSSTIAPQALLLMNDPFVIEQCEAAGKMIAAHSGNLASKIELCFQKTLVRNPTEAENRVARSFLAGW